MNLVAELRNLLGAEASLIDDPAILPSYSHDQSQIAGHELPACVLLARNVEEISKTMVFARQHQIPIVARGAGSGLAGGANAIANSIVISLEKMNSILEIDPVNQIARVQPGVINLDLDSAVANHGLAYLPDPASREWSTIGGNVATNAGGMCCIKYGVTANHIRAIEVVIGDGSVITLGHPVKKHVTGLNLMQLLIGSEGTLGIITEITVALDVASAAGAVPELVKLQPSMLEIVDNTTIQSVEQWKPLGFENVGAVLIFQSDDGVAKCEQGREIALAHGAHDSTFSDDPRDSADLLMLRKLAYPSLERAGAALLDDVCVPISAISKLVEGVEHISKQHNLTIGVFGHAGDGNMHPTIVYEHGNLEAEQRARKAFQEIIDLAQRLGGTASGEHGIGSIKIKSAAHETGLKEQTLQREIKRVFDPAGILNPRKKFL
jgi:glycolate oxidase